MISWLVVRHGDQSANEANPVSSNSYEKVKTFKNLGSILINQNSIHEDITFTFKSGNSCYYSVQTLLSSRLLSRNFKIKIHKTKILPDLLYGQEEWL